MSSQVHPAQAALAEVLAAASGGAGGGAIEVESLTAHRYGSEGLTGYLVGLRGLPPYFVDHGGAVQTVTIPSTPGMDRELMVRLVKSGGIAGIHQEITLSEFDGSLAVEDAATLLDLFGQVDFFSLTPEDSGNVVHDGINYTIMGARGRHNKEWTLEQGRHDAAIEQLMPLISWLEAKLPDALPKLVLD